ncbi:MAG: UbiA-like polyprenyltransferase [Acidobacteriota bacterium]
MIKFEHTVFALPFAYLGAFLAARGFPGWEASLWILLAMVGARSAAMAFNRLVDCGYDQLNPRTAARALPRGLVTRSFVVLFIATSAGLFFFSAWMLNWLAFYLSPLALTTVLAYSYTKRFTSLSHLFLGLSLAIAPVGGWVAVRGQLDGGPFVLSAAVLLWVSGFDILYACQDIDFDRRIGLHSLPARLGVRRALVLAAVFHGATIALLLYAFLLFDLSLISWAGLILISLGLIYEHSLVKPGDLSRLNAAFFTVNGLISIVLFLFVGFDLCLFA